MAVRHVAEAHGADCAIKDHMSADPLVTVSPDAPRRTCTKNIRSAAWRVVDTEGHLLGVIAQADVATKENRDKQTGEIVERISESRDPLR